ncbi:transcription elongation regulator [Boothiomyces macroporosus]|uniref:Transcription elongation regulator n=1 Tax=Boothiomyces macroporosus TaxID=261099 RepID=A0AAD5Y5X8_9FUNG|nr:transcription elongation regulator [Boothiomyces macroporosus]
MEKINLAWSVQYTPDGKQYFFNSLTNESTWERPAEYMPPKPPPLKEKPIKMRKIPDSDWNIILTNKDHEFFYNQATKQVSWDIPDDIINLVGELLNDGMDEEMSEDEPEYQDQGNSNQNIEQFPTQYDLVVENQVQEEVLENQVQEEVPVEPESIPEVEADPIPEEPDKPHEEIVSDFNQMLRDLNASPFSTWNMEEEKLSKDPRFIALKSNKERKSLYEQYCAIRSKEIQLEKQNKVHDSKSGFQELLDQHVSVRTRYEDFSRKFKRDSKFIKFSSPLERQQLFQEHIRRLREAEQQSMGFLILGNGELFIEQLRKLAYITKDTTWTEVIFSNID